MANFSAKWFISVQPLEEAVFTNTSVTCKKIHSQIGRTFAGSSEASAGTTSTNVGHKVDHTTTASYVTLNNISLSGAPQGFRILYIRITAAASSSTPDVLVSLNAGTNTHLALSGVGDCMLATLNGQSEQDIAIKSSGATTTAKIEIMVSGS